MALIRRSGARFSANIWPGFVDAMTAILLVLMFVLSIFMIVQSILRDTITGQNSELAFLNTELIQIKNDLGLERSKLAQLDARYEERLRVLNLTEEKFNLQRLKNQKLDQQLILKAKNLVALKSSFTGLSSQLESIQDQLLTKTAAFSLLQKKQMQLQKKVMLIDAASKERIALLSALRAKFKVSSEKVQTFQTQVAGLLLRNMKLAESLDQSKKQIVQFKSENELVKLALSNAREEFDEKVQSARLAAARADALELLVLDLRSDQKTLENLNNNLVKKSNDQEMIIMQKTGELIEKTTKLIQVEKNSVLERAAIENLKAKLSLDTEELGLLTLTLEAERKKALKTLELLASARAVQVALKEKNKQLVKANDSVEQALELKQIALREARVQLMEEKGLTRASLLEVERLNLISAALTEKLSQLEITLDKSEVNDEQKNVQIKLLGSRLNSALARVASEQRKRAELEAKEVEKLKLEANDLKSYRSEFFGRLRARLGGKPGIEIVGDRFVFASEVLFQPGSATLGVEGQLQLGEVAQVIREVAVDIPPQINWILRVDGHTDVLPLAKTSEFSDNWALSQARSLSVVKYLIRSEGVPSYRLAATGFGQFQPIDLGTSLKSLARNRRIELKLTEK
jgi:chemotaxis protein MotB